MNKLIVTIIATVLLTSAGTVMAQDFYGEPGNKGQRHHRGMQAMPAVEQLMRGIRRLDLDDAQQENIRAIMQDLKAEARPIMEETRAGHLQLKELVKADTYDEKAVAALAEKEGDLAAERMMITSRALSEVFSHLTEGQRTQLEEMSTERMARRSERRNAGAGKD
jgi:protein CpxP